MGYFEADRDYSRVKLHCLHVKSAGERTWKTAHTKQNQQIYTCLKWDVLWMLNFRLRLNILIKVKDHKSSSDTLDFLSVICYALKCHGHLWTSENKNKRKKTENNSILGP